MFTHAQKIILLIGTVTSGLFLFLVVLSLRHETALPPSPSLSLAPHENVLEEKFFPTSIFVDPATNTQTFSVPTWVAGGGTVENPLPVQNIPPSIGVNIPSPLPSSRLLPLPPVSDAEITLDANGIETPLAYADYFARESKNIPFDFGRFRTIPKNPGGVMRSLQELFREVATQKQLGTLRDALFVYEDFLRAENTFLGAVRVHGKAAVFNKEMIGANKLALTLLDEAKRFERGEISDSHFLEKVSNYEYTISYYAKKYESDSGLFSSGVFGFISDFLVARIAHAAPQGALGGKIEAITECTCGSGGYRVSVNAPSAGAGAQYSGGAFFTKPYLASPLFYGSKKLVVGYYILALTQKAEPPVACLPQPEEVCEWVTLPNSTTTVEECHTEYVCKPEVDRLITISGTAKP